MSYLIIILLDVYLGQIAYSSGSNNNNQIVNQPPYSNSLFPHSSYSTSAINQPPLIPVPQIPQISNNNNYNQLVDNNYEDIEESDEINQDGDLIEEYYNYNELLNPYMSQNQVEMTLDTIVDNMTNILISEK